jgi:hypothetical protein
MELCQLYAHAEQAKAEVFMQLNVGNVLTYTNKVTHLKMGTWARPYFCDITKHVNPSRKHPPARKMTYLC